MESSTINPNDEAPLRCHGTTIEVVNLSYGVRVGRSADSFKTILHDISFKLSPGSMVALMGPSGSGKSTLMDLLADRKTMGEWSGDIFFNHGPRLANFHRDNAYVLQDDLHLALLTVQETVRYAARLRLPDGTSEADIEDRVDKLLEFLGLSHVRDSLVGDANIKGISGGQMKRLSIAVEMVALPEVIFLDEPTSGLDTAVAMDTMQVVRKLADVNRTIISTIHQPSPEIFELFDAVVMIVAGRLAYFGPTKMAVAHFTSSALNFTISPGRNPAEFIIDCCEGKTVRPKHRPTPFTPLELESRYRASEYHYVPLTNEERMSALAVWNSENNTESVRISKERGEFATSLWTQTKVLMHRQGIAIMRDRSDWIAQVMKNIILGLLLGVIFFDQLKTNPPLFTESGIPTSQVTNISSLLYFACLHTVISNAQSIPYLCSRMTLYRREIASKTYATMPYWLTNVLYGPPHLLVGYIFFILTSYFMVGFPIDAEYFWYYFVVVFLSSLTSYFCAMFLAAAIGTETGALAVFPVTYLFFANFAGYSIVISDLPLFWREWAPYISYIRWTFQGLMVNHWQKYEDIPHPSSSVTVLELYSFSDFDKWWSLWILCIWIIFACGIVYLALIPSKSKLVKVSNMITVEEKETAATVDEEIAENGGNVANEDAALENVSAEVSTLTPQTLVFKDVTYETDYVNKKTNKKETLEILKGISGYVLPGQMCALMGASGSGKSTLLDVIADRKTMGTIGGSVILNGKIRTPDIMSKSAYVMQFSELHAVLTVRETLRYAALLRLPQYDDYESKMKQVEDTMAMLGISHIADSLVGNEIVRGISGGQKKRLSIGVEIIHSPSIIFLDEPTTGLDSAVSFEVMSAVRRLASQKRTIISTIHQPSPETYALFDTLLLLSYGRVMYFGDAKNVVNYFSTGPYVFPYKDGSNVADYVICVASGSVPTIEGVKVEGNMLVDHYESSELCASAQSVINGWAEEQVSEKVASSTRLSRLSLNLYSTNTLYQTYVLTCRLAKYRLRNKTLSFAVIIRNAVISIFYGTLYLNLKDGTDPNVYTTRLALLFFCTVAFLMTHQQDIPDLMNDRLILYRERGAYAYNNLAYVVSRAIVQAFISIFSVATFVFIMYYMVGLTARADRFFFFYIMMYISDITSMFLAMIISHLSPSSKVGLSLYPVALFFITSFQGFIVFLPKFPDWLRWASYIMYLRYTFQASVLNEFNFNSELPLANYYIDMLGFDSLTKTDCAGYAILLYFGLGFLAYLGFVFISFEKR